MPLLPAALERIIRELSKLPGIGEKTATRLAYHLLKTNRHDVEQLSQALLGLRNEIKFCTVCLGMTDQDPCSLCGDERRDSGVLCVVEQPPDIAAIERSGQFRGRYHVLHGRLSPLDGIGPDELRIGELLRRLEDGRVSEVVVATNPTVEGEATAIYLAKLIKPLKVRVTRIAHGLPVGGDVEYADSTTIGRAMEGRREL